MNQSIDRLNDLSNDDAQAEFLKCCGSKRWAQMMTEARPCANLEGLVAKAGSVWWALSQEDWREAFRAHPKIGEKKAAALQSDQAQNWSAQEQSGVDTAATKIKTALALGNREYEQRFGFIYIVCAKGKTAEEMLAILQERLKNDPDEELRIAALEQSRITEIRLRKLLAE